MEGEEQQVEGEQQVEVEHMDVVVKEEQVGPQVTVSVSVSESFSL